MSSAASKYASLDLGLGGELPARVISSPSASFGAVGPPFVTRIEFEPRTRRANEILKAASVFFATELDADRPK